MRLIDLSQPLFDGCPNCPVHPPVSCKVVEEHDQTGWRMEHLSVVSHTGSHLDAPLHKVKGGGAIDSYPLESFVGDAIVVDLRGIPAGGKIDATLLDEKLGSIALRDRIVLLATGWGEKRSATEEWLYNAPRLTPDGAEWLVRHGIRGVGIDHYSIGGSPREPENAATHTVLLSKGVWVVEELKFPDEVFRLPQPVKFWALPINLKGWSGSFCRPVIVVE